MRLVSDFSKRSVRREGMLLIWAEPGGLDPRRMRDLAASAPIQSTYIAWPRAAKKPPLHLHYAVIPPAGYAKP